MDIITWLENNMTVLASPQIADAPFGVNSVSKWVHNSTCFPQFWWFCFQSSLCSIRWHCGDFAEKHGNTSQCTNHHSSVQLCAVHFVCLFLARKSPWASFGTTLLCSSVHKGQSITLLPLMFVYLLPTKRNIWHTAAGP